MSRFRVALVAVLLLAGLTQAQGPVQRTVDEFLRQRAEAVLTRDEALFLAGVDDGIADQQRRLFRNLAALPLKSWSYDRDGDRVRLTYTLADVDQQPVTKDLGYEFVHRHDGWRLHVDKPVLPWDFAPLQVRSNGGGIVLSHPGDEALADSVLAELEPAVRAVSEVWGDDWARAVAVVIPRDPDELRNLVGSTLVDMAGVAVADRADPPTGQRVVINPDRVAGLSQLQLGILIRHEITHVAARRATRATAPLWLLEGFADYVAFRGLGLTLGQAAPQLTSDVTGPPTNFTGPDRDLAYQQAYSICAYLAEKLGERGLVDFYRAHQSEVDPRMGFSLDGWREYLRKHIG